MKKTIENVDEFYKNSICFFLDIKRLSTYDVNRLNFNFKDSLPTHLYKYRKAGINGFPDFYISNNLMRVTKLKDFPDEFEGITTNVLERIKKCLDSKSLAIEYKDIIVEEISRSSKCEDKDLISRIFDTMLECDFDEDEVYKKCSKYFQKNERQIIKKSISACCYFFEKFTNDLENKTSFAKGMQMLIDTNVLYGAYCMCEEVDNDALWINYAESFKGYCIEYDLNNPYKSRGSINFISRLYPVIYKDNKDDDWLKAILSSTFESIDEKGNANELSANIAFNIWILKTICTKKQIYSNEHEWRYVDTGPINVHSPLISKIIVGHKINKKDYLNIKECANKLKVPLFITSPNCTTKKIDVRELTEEDLKCIMERDE